jgi:hypothetical protein
VTPYKTGVAQPPVTFSGKTADRIVTPLPNGTHYRFRVAAVNAVGKGPNSALTAAIVVGEPGQPGKPYISKGGDRPDVPLLGPGAVWLNAARPRSNGAPILHRDARCNSSNGGKTRTQRLDFSEGPRAKVTNLTPGKNYRCTVTATNRYDIGPRSKPSNELAV